MTNDYDKQRYIYPLLLCFAGIIAAAAFAAHVLPAKADTVAFNSNLYYGLTNNQDVQQLQEFLTAQGDYSGPITGNFYSLTLVGVKRFQTDNGINPVSGYFGVLSRGVANGILAASVSAPTVEVGTSTSEVPFTGTQVQAPANTNQNATTTLGGLGAVSQPPTCTLSATVSTWPQGTQHAQFQWSFTPGASATLEAVGTIPNSNLQFAANLLVPSNYQYPAESSQFFNLVYSSSIFQTTTYEMDVTLNGLTGSCTAVATI